MKNVWKERSDGAIEIVLPRRTGEALVTVIEASDFALVDSFPGMWRAQFGKNVNGYYATGSFKGSTVSLHRWIMAAPPGKVVDHLDFDTLNNRRSNLSVVTLAENLAWDRRKRPGRWIHMCHEKWNISVWFKGKSYCFGATKSRVMAEKYVSTIRRLLVEASGGNANEAECRVAELPTGSPMEAK